VKLKGTQILLQILKEEKVDTIFGYPGGSVIDIYDELYRSDIKHILVRHEQAAVHAADGYARSSGKVGVALVTSGPGATNTVTGIATAHSDSIPIVVFTGQVPTTLIGNDAFQESDITGITRPCTKHNFLVRTIEELAPTIKEAFHIARTGRPGPVLVDLPKNIMASSTEYDPAMIAAKTDEPLHGAPSKKFDQTMDLLREAKNPVVLIGGGVLLSKASQELRAFIEKTRIPVTSTLMGLGGFPGTHPLWLGMLGMHGTYYANMAISHCDLLITLGARFSDRVTGKIDTFADKAKIIHIDVDPSSINKNVVVDLPIVSDIKIALTQLNRMMEEQRFTFDEARRQAWIDRIDAWKRDVPLTYCQNGQIIKPQFVVEKLFELTRGKAFITTEVGQNQMWAAQFYRYDNPHTFVSSGGLGTMGYGFPAAIGVQCAFPDALVVDIAGDGSIQMNIQEMATAVQYHLPVKIVLLNNNYLGMVRQWQEMFYEKRYSHTEMMHTPDFVKVAEAYGFMGLRTSRPEEVEPMLMQGLFTPGPVLMEFQVAREECVYPMVRPGASICEMALGTREMTN
jgi:acetolactate synthase-1/2/3 large subunit